MFLRILGASAISLAASSQLLAAQTINSFEISGNNKNKVESIRLYGCGDRAFANLRSNGVVNGNNQDALAISLDLIADSRRNDSFYCDIEAKINVPAGKMFRIDSAFFDGYVRTSSNGAASIYYRYELDASGDTASEKLDFSPNRNTGFSGEARVSRPRFTSCSNRPQTVTLRAVIEGDVYDRSSSSSSLEVGESVNEATSWHWSWDSCGGGSTGGGSVFGPLPSRMTSTRGSTLQLTYDKQNSLRGVVDTYKYRSFYPSVGQNYSGTFTIFSEDNTVIVDSISGHRYFGKYSPSRRQMVWYNVDFGYGPTNVTWLSN
jgi:hypothetical protein